MPDSNSLNENQRKAVHHTQGPLLIIAGAGSGKTRTLTHRVAHLLENNVLEKGQRILAITFTNKAAQEMKTRIHELCNNTHLVESHTFIGTFHAFGALLLRHHAHHVGRSSAFTIFDEKDTNTLIKRLIKELAIGTDSYGPAQARHELSRIKSELILIDEYEASAQTKTERSTAQLYYAYEAELREQNAFDFDDLIEKPVRILQAHQNILSQLKARYPYILIDEYQDTNVAQYRLVRLLADNDTDICVVGDDAQSIYGWRGADFRNFLNFDKDWNKATIITLDQNYRSTETILKAANSVIEKNVSQKKKELWTQKSGGEPVFVVETRDEEQEAAYIVNAIKDHIDDGVPPHQCAVFYRTNAQSRALEEAFLRAELPYHIVGGVKFYQRKEIKDVLAYLRILANTTDTIALERIISVPRRGISANRLRKHGYDISRFPEFSELVTHLRDLAKTIPVSELILGILEKVQYRPFIEKYYDNPEERWENVLELLSLAQQFDAQFEPEESLQRFLESVQLMESTDIRMSQEGRLVTGNTGAVQLMTIHAAKGLEFDIVFVAGCEEGLLPHSRSLGNKDELEEERRLAYVAFTRARDILYCSFSKHRRLFGKREHSMPSQFIYDIPPEITEFVSTTGRNTLEDEENYWIESDAEEENWDEWIDY